MASFSGMTLDEWMREKRLPNGWLAKAVPAHEITITKWRRHRVVPRPATMRRIEQITEGAVQPADWYGPVPEAPRVRILARHEATAATP